MKQKKVIRTKEELINYQVGKFNDGDPLTVIHTIICNMLFKNCSQEQIIEYVINEFTKTSNKLGGNIKNDYLHLIEVIKKLAEIGEVVNKELDEKENMGIAAILITIYKNIENIVLKKIKDL